MASIYLSKEGRDKLVTELENLQKRKPLLQEEIARAREHGDLKENAEYHAAKESLTNLAKRMAELEAKLSRAKIIDDSVMDKSTIYIGSSVFIKETDSGDEYEYKIVDAEEADLIEKKISVQSPMSQGLLGHKKGDIVKIQLPVGLVEYKIVKISR
jgi:transcription elongation factor GreA